MFLETNPEMLINLFHMSVYCTNWIIVFQKVMKDTKIISVSVIFDVLGFI